MHKPLQVNVSVRELSSPVLGSFFVNYVFGLRWMLSQDVLSFFFPPLLPVLCLLMKPTLTHPLLHSFQPPLPPLLVPLSVLFYVLPCPVSAPSHHVRFSHSVFSFSLLPAPLALPPGNVGTVMFMKPFNVLCNYPGNTSHHYSCQ